LARSLAEERYDEQTIIRQLLALGGGGQHTVGSGKGASPALLEGSILPFGSGRRHDWGAAEGAM
jgi:hypothetical protein